MKGKQTAASQTSLFSELITDNFCGGGGASVGMELATGRPVDIAINHDPAAILLHKTNHPYTRHYKASVWDIDPIEVCHGQPVGLAWFSPDCKHFSKAKGSKPVSKKIRGLAWIVLRWAANVRPRVIMLENVEEFQTWGPVRKGKPVKKLAGTTFQKWLSQLHSLGYEIDYRELRACDYGAPTIRRRFFLIARCDNRPIVWPTPTHGDPASAEVLSGKLKPWRTVAEIINWGLPCPSIFQSSTEIQRQYHLKAKRPLVDKTLCRIAEGLHKFILENPEPYIIQCNHGGNNFRGQDISKPLKTVTGKHGYALTMPILTQYHSFKDQNYRGQTLDKPLLTVDTSNRYAVTCFRLSKYADSQKPSNPFAPCLIQLNHNCTGQSVSQPLNTITAGAGHFGIMAAYLEKYYGQGVGQQVSAPLDTVVSKDRFGLIRVTITKVQPESSLGHWLEIRAMLNQYCGYHLANDEILLLAAQGESYFISDIGLRMLTPRELYDAQGFPEDYVIDRDYTGRSYPKKDQVAKCGNAVPPQFAKALVLANVPELCVKTCSNMADLFDTMAS